MFTDSKRNSICKRWPPCVFWNLFRIIWIFLVIYRVLGVAVCWGNALQASRSRVLLPMWSLGWLFLSRHNIALQMTQPVTGISPETCRLLLWLKFGSAQFSYIPLPAHFCFLSQTLTFAFVGQVHRSQTVFVSVTLYAYSNFLKPLFLAYFAK